jgi:hypothetical protein
MFSVGSVGIVDPGDSGKVVCAGPIIQLGAGIGGLEPVVAEAPAAVAARVSVLQTAATIRYPVPVEEPAVSSVLGLIALQLRYRSGDGRAIATLMEVAVPPGGPGDSGTVSERPLLQFDSSTSGAASVFFQTANAHLPRDSALYDYRLAFGPNVYYVSLTLTGPAFVAGQPPAVAAVELIGLEPPAGGNGGNGNGGGTGNGGYDGGNGGSGGGDGGPDDGPGHQED